MNVALVIPALPSVTVTSVIVRFGKSSFRIVPVAEFGTPTVYPEPAANVMLTVSSASLVASAVGLTVIVPVVLPAGMTNGLAMVA